MNHKKTALFLSLWLGIGFTTLSGTALASHPTDSKPAVSMPDSNLGGAGSEEHCDMHKPGMMGSPMSEMKGDDKAGMAGGAKAGMMCDHDCNMMESAQCDQHHGMMGGQHGGMMGSTGMMGGAGMMGGSGMMMQSPRLMMVKSFDLNSEQRAKFNKLSDALRHNNWTAMGSIMDEAAALRDLYAADKRDPSAIGKVYKKIFDLQRQMIEATIDTENRVAEILTPEQRTRLKKMHR